MTDLTPQPESTPAPEADETPSGSTDLAVDLADFLPEWSALAAPSGSSASPPDGDETTSGTVDVRVLEQLEADLAGVDDAIEAIDADDHGRSSLLQELLTGTRATGDQPAP